MGCGDQIFMYLLWESNQIWIKQYFNQIAQLHSAVIFK